MSSSVVIWSCYSRTSIIHISRFSCPIFSRILISYILHRQQNFLPSNYVMKLWWELNLFRFIAQICTRFMLTHARTNTMHFTELWLAQICFVVKFHLLFKKLFSFFHWLTNIHIFDYLESRLSGLFISVPTRPNNQGLPVHDFYALTNQNLFSLYLIRL